LTMNGGISLFGLYESHLQVDKTVAALQSEGFGTGDISVLFPEKPVAAETSGKALALLAGIGALAIPGFGPFIVAGPIVGALAGAGGNHAGVAGALWELGLSEDEAMRYDQRIRSGGILLSVNCRDLAGSRRARMILESSGAAEVASVGAACGAGRW
jgi:hypothetical protein